MNRILVIRTSALGDVVLVSPALRALHRTFPEARIELLTAPPFVSFFEGLPFLHQVWSMGAKEPVRDVSARLQAEGPFDLVVDLQNKVRTFQLLSLLRPKQKLRLVKRRGLGEVAASLAGRDKVLDDRPAAALYLELLAPLGCKADDLRPELHLDPQALATADRLLNPAHDGIPTEPSPLYQGGRGFGGEGWQYPTPQAPSRTASEAKETPLSPQGRRVGGEGTYPIVALAPGARWALKRWPAERFAEVGNALAAEGARLLLVGGPGDEDTLRVLRGHLHAVPLADTLALDVAGLAAALRRADLLITSDSAPSHLAQAVGTPVVAVFGPTSARRWGPLPEAGAAVSLPLACAPCTNHGRGRCPLGDRACLDRLEAAPVLRAARAALAAGRAKGGKAAAAQVQDDLVGLALEAGRLRRGAADEAPPRSARPAPDRAASGDLQAPQKSPPAASFVERLHRQPEPLGQHVALAPLLPLEGAFAAAAATRRALYRKNLLRSHEAPIPVLSVGNLAVGGAGKTPVVLFLARELQARGWRVAILGQGYGGKGWGPRIVSEGRGGAPLLDAADAGDEALLLARRCPDAAVLVGSDRSATASLAARELGAEIALLDDGFQHLALRRDLDLVVLDGASPFGNGHLLPRGPLREAPAALARAQLCWISKVDQGDPAAIEAAAALASRLSGSEPVRSRYRVEGLLGADLREEHAIAELQGTPVLLLAALARPASFRRTLESVGAQIVDEALFPDHRGLDPSEWAGLLERRKRLGARWILCTEKDAVKLPAALQREPAIRVLRVESEIVQGRESLERFLARLSAKREVRTA